MPGLRVEVCTGRPDLTFIGGALLSKRQSWEPLQSGVFDTAEATRRVFLQL